MFYSSIGEKNAFYKKISLLTPGVNISYFVDKLDKPAVTHTKVKTKEFIFISKYFYVQAVTDMDDMVRLFSITSRINNFNPTFKMPGFDKKDKNGYVTLNKTTFFDVFKKIEKYEGDEQSKVDDYIIPECQAFLGAHRFAYYEGSYLANPGNYQSFYIGVNDAGYYEYDDIDTPKPFSINSIDDCLTVSNTFRRLQKINTYVETDRFSFAPEKTANNDFPALEDDEVRVIDRK